MVTSDDETQTELSNIKFEDLFNLEKIQKIQDAFANATGVGSAITDGEGRRITRHSNPCYLCDSIIRKTEKSLKNCYPSDVELGRRNPNDSIIQPCLSSGLWDASTGIIEAQRPGIESGAPIDNMEAMILSKRRD